MTFSLSNAYYRLVLDKPRTTLLLLAMLVCFFAWHSSNFRLDASSDSLTLENDQALKYYQAIEARYGSDDFLVITYTPIDDLFSDRVKTDIRELSDELMTIQRVESVVTILDVPLIDSPPVTLSELQDKVLTLESPDTDQMLARQELLTSPLYKNLLISSDGKMTAIQVNFKRDKIYHQLLEQRSHLREKQLEDNLTASEKEELKVVSKQFERYMTNLQKQEHNDILQVRQIMAQHREQAKLFLGGIPMITSDSIDFINHDLMTFGIGVLIFVVVLLTIIFNQLRWIILPMITCGVAGLVMIGFLGWINWPVTVVSSNFISLMLIITLSLMVHLIVSYRELQAQDSSSTHLMLIRQMIVSKIQPSFYTAITSIVAFASLIISGIRPIIDFGWMMTIGISMSFVLAFTLFPAMLALLPATNTNLKYDITGIITRFFARLIQRFDIAILLIFMLLAIISIVGISRLSVENRFIDYYKESTEIYQGMTLIDKKLGGTTPLDVIIDAPADFFQSDEDISPQSGETNLEADEEFDSMFEEFELEMDENGGITSTSYWLNSTMLPEINSIHDYLVSLPESGKVLSIASSMRMLSSLDDSMVVDDLFLSILYKRLPDNIKVSLFSPYK